MRPTTRNRLFLLVGIAAILALYGKLRQPTGPREVPSPDGTYVLRSWINNLQSGGGTFHCVEFEIENRSGSIVHHEQTHAPGSTRWRIGWDDRNRVWLNNVQTGMEYWELGPDAIWRRSAYDKQSGLTPPKSVAL